MDDDAALRVLGREADALADAAGPHLDRAVPTYAGWTVADVVTHTGRIHRWVTGIVRDRVTRRPEQPAVAVPAAQLVAWFSDGAADLADMLAATAPDVAVWGFAGDATAGFWRRRMALETTIHRWDTQAALGDAAPIADGIASAGVTEALQIYLQPRLRGEAVAGAGEVVRLRADGAPLAWAVRLHSDAIEVCSADEAADSALHGTPADLWLFLMGRLPAASLRVEGAAAPVDLLERAIGWLPGPRR